MELVKAIGELKKNPWVCMGDYNDLLMTSDKKGGNPHPAWLFRGFREAVLDCNLYDIDFLGLLGVEGGALIIF